jgi:hypothetical protein
MSFPSSLDDLSTTRGTTGAPLSNPNHITHHTAEDTAIQALEAKVGIDSSAVTTSLDYKLKNAASIDPGHKHTNTSVTLALDDMTDVVITTPINGNGLTYNGSNWVNSTTSTADASTTVKGVTKLSVAPASPTAPIAVGDNDPRFVTDSGGTLNGTTNKLIDQTSVTATATANKVARRNAAGDLAVNTTPTNGTDATSKTYTDTKATIYANGTTTRAGNTASGTQNIAHGLGKTPTYIRITARKLITGLIISSDGVYNGTTTSCVFLYMSPAGGVNSASGVDSTNIILIDEVDIGANRQEATVTVNATNIVLSWTKSGTTSSDDINIMWEARA